MDILKENLTKFIDSIIVEDYSKAHKFLEIVINEKVKAKIKKAAKKNPFAKDKLKKSKNKSAVVSKESGAFGEKEMPQAKNPNKKK